MDNRRLIRSCPWVLVTTVCLALLALGITWMPQPLGAEGELPAFEPGQILVKVRPAVQSAPDAIAARHHATLIADVAPRWYLMAVPVGQEQQAILDFSTDGEIEAAELNYLASSPPESALIRRQLSQMAVLYPLLTPVQRNAQLRASANDAQLSTQWNLFQIRVASLSPDEPSAWDYTVGSKNLIIAILSTGVDYDHPDLAGKLLPGYDFVNNDNDPSEDGYGMGTMEAGIAAAASNNQVGIAGVSWGARILPVKVLNAQGVGTYTNIIRGIFWAVDHGAKILNMSFAGYSPPSAAMQEAINYAIKKRVLPVAAAGNKGNDPVIRTPYPAALEDVLAVTATDQHNSRLTSAGYGPFVDIAAPGEDIYGPYWQSDMGRGYALGLGTEFAAPHVSGVAALIWSMNPTLMPLEVADMIKKTGQDLGPSGPDQYYGYGLVDAETAVRQTPHYLQTNQPFLLFGQAGDSISPSQYTIINDYSSKLSWHITTTADWLVISDPSAGTPSVVTISVAPAATRGCDSLRAQVYVSSQMDYKVNSPIKLDALLRYNRPCSIRLYLPLVPFSPTTERH